MFESITVAATAIFVSWFTVTGFVWKLFTRIEKAATDEAREVTGNWFLSLEPGKNLNNLSIMFRRSFDTVFGAKHFSWHCIYRSCIASIISVLILYFVWVATHPEVVPIYTQSGWRLYTDIMTTFLAASILNLIPDYISLLQTRIILQRVKNSSSEPMVLFWLLLDFILTTVIASLPWIILFGMMFGKFVKPMSEYILPLANSVYISSRPGVSSSTNMIAPSFGIFFYSTFFTSVWLWIYILAGYITKLSIATGSTLSFLKRMLFRKEQPFLSLGAISVVLITMIYLVVAPFIIVFNQ